MDFVSLGKTADVLGVLGLGETVATVGAETIWFEIGLGVTFLKLGCTGSGGGHFLD
jgi:hypothetical protein